MADNPLKYSDLLQPDNSIENAITQLKELNQTYAETLQKVKSEAIKLQANIEGVSGATEEHRNKIRETTAQVDKLTKAQNDLEFAMSDTAKQIAELKLQQQEAQQLAKLQAKLNTSEKDSYNALSAQYSINKIQLNKLSQEYRENTEQGKKLVKETEEIYARMKKLQEATGKYTLNVGNYKSSWDGLGVSAQQLVRELPSLAVSANTFFLAISNNIPMLVDEINKLKIANKQAAAEGQATTPVWESVTEAFFSWNTAISLGITLLTVFGGDLIDWIGSLFKSEKAVDALKQAMDGLNEAELTGMQNAQQQLVRLNLLYNATQDVTRSQEERKKAVEELKKQFPGYFDNMTDEKILAGEAATEYNKLAKSIIATSMARAAEEKLVENSKEILKLETEKAQAMQDQEKAMRKLETAKANVPDVVFGGDAGIELQRAALKQVRDAQSEVDKYGEAASDAQTKIDALNAANAELANRINIEDLTATTTTTGTGKGKKDRSEQIGKANLDITKKLYQSETALISDEMEKRRQALIDAYNSEKAELENKLKNDKDLTEQSRENINKIIVNKQKKLNQDLAALDVEVQRQALATEQETLELRLEAVRKGSEEENVLKIKLLENARQQELLENRTLAENKRQDEKDINAKYDREILLQDSNFNKQRALLLFDQQQELNQSEFDLLETTEAEKTRFKLQAEKERLQKILELNKTSAEKLSDTEVEIIKNTIKKIDKEIEKSKTSETKDIYDLLGIKLDDDEKQAISQSVGFSIEQLQSILDAQVQIKDQALQAAKEETQAAQDKLNAELEARNNGYANDVDTARKELQLAKDKEKKAAEEKEKAQKRQLALNTILQTSNLITASTEIWKALSGISVVGIALAIAGIATMWGSFAAAQVKARQVVKTEYGDGGIEFLEGGSHASGNDIPIGTTKDGRSRRAEGGEALIIINKRNTRKYKDVLPGITKSLNSGRFENMYGGVFNVGDKVVNINLSKIESEITEIRKNQNNSIIIRPDGAIIETKGNVRRIIK